MPTVLSIVDQVSQFKQILASKPVGAQWDSSNTLFAFWIGINDVGNSFVWLEILYQEGARSFLFLTVAPTDRAPLFLQQGSNVVKCLHPLIANYNAQLAAIVENFKTKHKNLDQVTVFDTQPIFNTLLNNANALGFVNVTGWCETYQNGTPEKTTQISPCAPFLHTSPVVKEEVRQVGASVAPLLVTSNDSKLIKTGFSNKIQRKVRYKEKQKG
ncbi:hypothetical protein C0995_008354 [Termitomyces sp. Mi166|nr:hypothetical protein C0995_008354 [Termitomyces sp. Mi166\